MEHCFLFKQNIALNFVHQDKAKIRALALGGELGHAYWKPASDSAETPSVLFLYSFLNFSDRKLRKTKNNQEKWHYLTFANRWLVVRVARLVDLVSTQNIYFPMQPKEYVLSPFESVFAFILHDDLIVLTWKI